MASSNGHCLDLRFAVRCVPTAIDIMVEFEPGARSGLIKFESLAEELESLDGRRVDLVRKRGLKPWVRPPVLQDARVIYAA